MLFLGVLLQHGLLIQLSSFVLFLCWKKKKPVLGTFVTLWCIPRASRPWRQGHWIPRVGYWENGPTCWSPEHLCCCLNSVYFSQPAFPFDGTRCLELFETLISVCSEQMISWDQLMFIIFSRHQKNRIKTDPLLPSTSPFCFLPYQLKIEQKDFFICMYKFGGSGTKTSSFCIDSTLKWHPGEAFWIESHFKTLGHFLPVFCVDASLLAAACSHLSLLSQCFSHIFFP